MSLETSGTECLGTIGPDGFCGIIFCIDRGRQPLARDLPKPAHLTRTLECLEVPSLWTWDRFESGCIGLLQCFGFDFDEMSC